MEVRAPFPFLEQFADPEKVEATRCPDLTVAELKGIRDLLASVQRKSVKSVQTAAGRSVRLMEPSCIQREMPHDGSSKTASFARRTVFTWRRYGVLWSTIVRLETQPAP